MMQQGGGGTLGVPSVYACRKVFLFLLCKEGTEEIINY